MGHALEKKPKRTAHMRSEKAAQRDVAAAPSVSGGITALPKVLDVGEQIFGSSHVFEIAAPFNLGAGRAQVSAEIETPGVFAIASYPHELAESGAAMSHAELQHQLETPIKVRFAPVADGEFPNKHFSANLVVSVKWQDGKAERHVVKLKGRARGLEDRPATAKRPASESASEQAPTKRQKIGPVDEGARAEFDEAFEKAKDNAAAIAHKQNIGAQAVKAAVGTYVAPPAPPSIWWDLVEVAVVMGTGVVAGAVASLVAQKLVGMLITAATANNKVTAASSAMANELAEAVKDGAEAGAKRALSYARASGGGTPSSNAHIAFFESHEHALNELAHENQRNIIDRRRELTPLLSTNPDAAIRAMEAVRDAFAAYKPKASEPQKHATAREWIAFKARMSLGTEQLPTREHETVTDLSKTRRASKDPHATPSAGLLNLVVDIEHGPPRVIAARLSGVAQAVADELRGADLAAAPMPLRFIVGWNEPAPTIITRDEAGRVRVAGDLKRLARFAHGAVVVDEAQAERPARELVEVALSRTLGQWGARIDTDDQSKG